MRKSQPFRKPYRFKKKRLILKSRFFWFPILILIAFLTVFYLVCFYSLFQIKEVEISGNQKVSAENIRNLIEINLPKKIIFLNSKSIFLVNFKKIEENLLGQLPQIGKVDFDRDFPNKLIVSVKERKPVAILEKGEDYFFVDEKGLAFEKISEKDSWLIIKNPSLAQELKLGEEVIEEEKLAKILEIRSELRKLEIRISLAEIISSQRVNIRTLEGWEIYFNLEDDVSQQVFNLNLVLKEKISPEERENLEYVDLRFGNQIYYK